MVDIRAGTYAACTPAREGDDPGRLGLDTATLPGGWYLLARITGEPPALYERIGPAMQTLEALAAGSAYLARLGLTGALPSSSKLTSCSARRSVTGSPLTRTR
jgi:hypothetical protein